MSTALSHLPFGFIIPVIVLVLWFASGRSWFDIFDGSSNYSEFDTGVQFNLMFAILVILGALGIIYLFSMHG